MRMFQFISARLGAVLSGKKDIVKTMMRYRIEKSLMGPPYLPRLQRAGGSFCPCHRLMRTQVMETMYEEMRAAVPREAMALKATLEPMLIKERRTVMKKDIITEFRGISQPGRTCNSKELAGIKLSRWTELRIAYVCNEAWEWEPSITSKGEHLTRCSSNICDASADRQDDENWSHEWSSDVRVGGCIKDLNERHHVRIWQNIVDIPHAEAERDQHDEPKRTVEDYGPHHCARQSEWSVFDFFRHL